MWEAATAAITASWDHCSVDTKAAIEARVGAMRPRLGDEGKGVEEELCRMKVAGEQAKGGGGYSIRMTGGCVLYCMIRCERGNVSTLLVTAM